MMTHKVTNLKGEIFQEGDRIIYSHRLFEICCFFGEAGTANGWVILREISTNKRIFLTDSALMYGFKPPQESWKFSAGQRVCLARYPNTIGVIIDIAPEITANEKSGPWYHVLWDNCSEKQSRWPTGVTVPIDENSLMSNNWWASGADFFADLDDGGSIGTHPIKEKQFFNNSPVTTYPWGAGFGMKFENE